MYYTPGKYLLTAKEVDHRVLSGVVTFMYISLGESLRQLRRQKNMTQTELGGKGYSKSYVSGIERGEIVPTQESLHFFAQQLGQPIKSFDALLQGARGQVKQSTSSVRASLSLIYNEGENRPELVTLLKLLLVGKKPYTLSLAHAFTALSNESLEGVLPHTQEALYACLYALLEQEQGKFQQALINFGYARAIAPAHYQPTILGAIGMNYFLEQQYQTALEYHLQALTLLNQEVPSETASHLLLTLELYCADDYRALGRYREACAYYQRAHQHLHTTSNMQIATQLYLGLGYCTYAVLYQVASLLEPLPRQSASDDWERAFQCALSFLLQSRTLYQVSHDIPGEAHVRLLQAMILLDFSSWRFHHVQEHARLRGTLLPLNTASLLDNAEEQCRYVLRLSQEIALAEESPVLGSEPLARTFEYTAYSYLIRISIQRAAGARLGHYTANALRQRSLAVSLCQRALDASTKRIPLTGVFDEDGDFSVENSPSSPLALLLLPALSPAEDNTAFPNPLSLSELFFAAAEVTEELGQAAATSGDALASYSQADQSFQAALSLAKRALPGTIPLYDGSSLARHYQHYIRAIKERTITSPETSSTVVPLLFSLLNDVLRLLPHPFSSLEDGD